jgi:hypothetical protein
VLELLYGALLLAGVAFAVSGIVVGIQRYFSEIAQGGVSAARNASWYINSHIGDGIVLLLLTAVYGFVFLRQRNTLFAPVAYVLSYGLCGAAFLVVIESAYKNNASDEILASLLLGGYTFIAPALIAAGLGLYFTSLRSKRA